jgi:DNA-directed RNA polymerase subunit RPC12/RpoP
MDPTDFFLYDEFLNPGTKYECQGCGTQFGDECVTWDEEAQCHVAVCPGCGSQAIVDTENNQQ